MSDRAPHSFSLRQLQYILAVAEHGGFRRAATACHVSQPSLSAQIAQVESLLGNPIFERRRRPLLVTPAGKVVIERARHVLRAADELEEAAKRLGDPFSGTLRLGVIPTLGPYLLPELAPELREAYPHLTQIWIEDKTERLVQALREGELDGSLVALESELGDVERVVLGKDPFVLAAAPDHPLVRPRRKLTPDLLQGASLLLLDDGHCFRDQALAFCQKAGADELAVRATSLSTLAQMVAAGAGVTLLPEVALDVENRKGTLRIRRFAGEPPSRTLALVFRRQAALEPTLRAVARVMRRVYRQRF